MLLFFFLFSKSVPQAEYQPIFLQNETEELEVDDSERVNTNVQFSSTTISSSKRNLRSFFRCYVTLTGVTFDGCFASGQGFTFSSGGALYLSASNLKSTGSTYENNIAQIAGAVSNVGGNMVFESDTFTTNTGFKYCGAIFSGSNPFGIYTEVDYEISNKVEVRPSLYIMKCNFEKNKGKSYGGAVVTKHLEIAYISETKFTSNKAGKAGGALFLEGTPTNLISNHFYTNLCQKDEDIKYGENDEQIFSIKEMSAKGVRGGGAVYFIETDNGDDQLYTSRNCFSGNAVLCAYNVCSDVGYDLEVLSGSQTEFIKWASIDDSSFEYNSKNEEIVLYRVSQSPPDNCEEHEVPTTSYSSPLESPSTTSVSFTETSYDEFLITPQPTIIKTREEFKSDIISSPQTIEFSTPTFYTFYSPSKSVPIEPISSSEFEPLESSSSEFEPSSSSEYEPDEPSSSSEYEPEEPSSSSESEIIVPPERTLVPPAQTHSPVIVSPGFTYTFTFTTTYMWTNSLTFTKTSIPTISNNIPITISETEIYIPIYTQTSTLSLYIYSDTVDNSSSNLPLIIGCAVGGFIVLLIIAVIIFFVVRKQKKEDSSQSSLVYLEETNTKEINDTSLAITMDNPLFSTTVNTDDPFQMDFTSSSEVEEINFSLDKNEEDAPEGKQGKYDSNEM